MSPQSLIRACSAAALLAVPAMLHAQGSTGRVEESHSFSDLEGRLMGYYSAAVAFSPIGPSLAGPDGSLSLGIEFSYLPPLSEAQRSGGFQKAESTNLLAVLPRPRASLSFAGFLIEGAWVPPVEVSSVKANLVSVSIARTLSTTHGIALTPRIVATTGSVIAPITCNSSMQRNGGGDSLFYHYICSDQESSDRFEPKSLGGELVAARLPDESRAISPYVGIGVRTERNKFDVGVKDFNGNINTAHPILLSNFTRGYGFAGAAWRGPRRTSVATELFYAPQSVLTVRLLARLGLGAR